MRDVIGAVVICIERPAVASYELVPSETPEIIRDREHRKRIAQGIKELLSAVAEVRNRIEEERGGVGEVPGLVVLVGTDEGSKGSEGNMKRKGIGSEGPADSGDNLKLGHAVEFSTSWWEDELTEMGHFELEVVAWDPKAELKEDKRNVYGGRYLSLMVYLRCILCVQFSSLLASCFPQF